MSSFFMGYIAPSIVLAPVAAGLYTRKHWDHPEKLIMGYLALSGGFNLLAKLTAHTNNLPLLHLYTVLEFCLLCFFYRSLSVHQRSRKNFLLLSIAFVVLAAAYVLFTRSLFTYNALPRFLSSITLTLLGIRFMAYRLGSGLEAVPSPHSRFSFIAVIALLLYFSCCSTLFGLSNYFMLHNADMEIDTLIWNIHAIFMSTMYLIFAAAYLILKKQ